MTIYQCAHCKNQMFALHDSKVPMICCGEPMQPLEAGVTDAAQEKHVPAAQISGSTLKVQVGEVAHPMLEEHYIQWIGVEQGDSFQFAMLHAGDAPAAEFVIQPGQPVTVYEYCNLHGLWKTTKEA